MQGKLGERPAPPSHRALRPLVGAPAPPLPKDGGWGQELRCAQALLGIPEARRPCGNRGPLLSPFQLRRPSGGQAAVHPAVLHPGPVAPEPAGGRQHRLLLHLPVHPLHHVHPAGEGRPGAAAVQGPRARVDGVGCHRPPGVVGPRLSRPHRVCACAPRRSERTPAPEDTLLRVRPVGGQRGTARPPALGAWGSSTRLL